MSFHQLTAKVRQAEDALEAHERRAVADWRQLYRTWKASWTAPRILIGGLAAGFLVGRRDSGSRGGEGASILRMLSMLSTLLATTSARVAANEADDAADSADHVADTVAPHGGDAVP